MSKNNKNKTILARVPVFVIDSLKRVMPDEEGFDNPQRFRILFKSSAVNVEDFLNGRRRKKK